MAGTAMRAPLTEAPSFQALRMQANRMRTTEMYLKNLWTQNPEGRTAMIIKGPGMELDYGYSRVTPNIVQLLCDLAVEMGLPQFIEQMFGGEKINRTENRAVGHVALRADRNESFVVDGVNQIPLVHEVLDKLEVFSNQIISGTWTGATGKRIDTIVSIGIGGSDYGPNVAYEALRDHAKNGIRALFVSNVDGSHLSRVMQEINPETTLFVIQSKSFTTQETIDCNGKSARRMMLERLAGKAKDEEIIAKHFVAVSTEEKLVKEFGIELKNMFGFWDWVGGRYSFWSAIGGIILGPTIGFDKFKDILVGGREVDQHYKTAPFDQNIPAMQALIRIWNRVFMKWNGLAIAPYSQTLRDFIFFLTQLNMESNGKGVDIYGRSLQFNPCSVFMGDAGSNFQHSFGQFGHQIPLDFALPFEFIGFRNPISGHDVPVEGRGLTQHEILLSNLFAQRRTLAFGKPDDGTTPSHKRFDGNRPSTLIMFDEGLNPRNFGRLVALEEHTTATEGAVQLVPSFDQPGVQEAKVGAGAIQAAMEQIKNGQRPDLSRFDPSTRRLLEQVMR